MNPPKAFVSYSHDSSAHIEWVTQLAADLVRNGIDVILDQWALAPGADMAAFMEQSIGNADRVLLICTEAYAAKANEGKGGVGYERLVVSAEVVAQISTKKFIPVVRSGGGSSVPRFLGPRRYIDFSDAANYGARLEELTRELHGAPAVGKPELGPNPYAATVAPNAEPARLARPSGLLQTGERLLGDRWFEERATSATQGIDNLGLNGAMEIRSALHDPIRKSQLELLNAVRAAEVHTFGWPIGVTLENRDEHRPRPFGDGIRAEVAIKESALSGEPSYDYWAVRDNGDFYILQSLFEDMHGGQKLFFNTRIVRIAEGLMFTSGLYEQLGVPLTSRVSIGFSHRGLAGRTLSTSNHNRQVWPRKSAENRSDGEITDSIEGIRKNLVDHVMRMASPMFMLFEFASFDRTIYDQIVTSFVNGQVT